MTEDQSHWETGPAVSSGPIPTYPPPTAGKATEWELHTDDGDLFGVITFNSAGAEYHTEYGDQENPTPLAQASADEVRGVMQDFFRSGIPLEETLKTIETAYADNMTVSEVVLGD